jgi:hypothetical protein
VATVAGIFVASVADGASAALCCAQLLRVKLPRQTARTTAAVSRTERSRTDRTVDDFMAMLLALE